MANNYMDYDYNLYFLYMMVEYCIVKIVINSTYSISKIYHEHNILTVISKICIFILKYWHTVEIIVKVNSCECQC
jgi:hypothetical protein